VANTEANGFTVATAGIVQVVYRSPFRREFIYPNGARLMEIRTEQYVKAVDSNTWQRSTLRSALDSQCGAAKD
jgi:hypothetical protein